MRAIIEKFLTRARRRFNNVAAMRLVVVEDVQMFREMLVKLCRASGHVVIAETASGREAIELARASGPRCCCSRCGCRISTVRRLPKRCESRRR